MTIVTKAHCEQEKKEKEGILFGSDSDACFVRPQNENNVPPPRYPTVQWSSQIPIDWSAF